MSADGRRTQTSPEYTYRDDQWEGRRKVHERGLKVTEELGRVEPPLQMARKVLVRGGGKKLRTPIANQNFLRDCGEWQLDTNGCGVFCSVERVQKNYTG